jgi:Glucose / Sorbosone dehydrogenase
MVVSVALVLFIAACNGSNDGGGFGLGGGLSPPPTPSNSLRLQPLSSVLTAPVFLTAPPGDLNRLFVVEQGGLIKILNSLNGTPRPNPFLDVSGLIISDVPTGGERGLLGMAFDPNITNRFFIYYTDTNGDIVIARYLVNSSNADLADTSSAFILKTINHRANSNNNGGMLAFGPDGCLYAGTGDGGGSGDPSNNAQTTTSLLGKILRLDPNTGNPCTLLTSNPFANGGGAPEVWSFGLRNPWRFSFDRTTGDLYIGDVGQSQREEVDAMLAPSAGQRINFGWNIMEGFLCFNPPSGCNKSGLTLPVLDYAHDNGACSIIGGYVYRGPLNPAATGRYFYADFCAGFVRSFQLQNGQPGSQNTWPLLSPPGSQITSFGEDARGELYLMTLAGGLFHIVAN